MVGVGVGGPVAAVDPHVLPRLDLPALRDGDGLVGPVLAVALHRLDVRDDAHPLDHLPEDNMLAVQVGTVDCRDEELGSVGVWSSVGHRKLDQRNDQ